MKDAVGGSILFYIIIAFIGIFIIFIAIIMNYAAAYRTNNYLINRIEQRNGIYPFGTQNDRNDSTIMGYLKQNMYYNGLHISCANNVNGAVFNVITYAKFTIPILDIDYKIPISNDTKTIFKLNCDDATVTIGDW